MLARSLLVLAILVGQSIAQAAPIKVQGQEFMPYQGTENGKFGGALKEIMDMICKKAALECVYESVPLNRSMSLLESGEASVVLGIATNPEREKFTVFPPPMTTNANTVFVKKGNGAKFTKIEDFKGKTIAVYSPSASANSAEKLLKEKPDAFVLEKETASHEAVLKKLDGGRYKEDAGGFLPRPMGLYFIKLHKLNLEPVSFDAAKANHGIGISKKLDPAIAKKIMDAQAEVMKTPEAQKILASHDLKPFDGK